MSADKDLIILAGFLLAGKASLEWSLGQGKNSLRFPMGLQILLNFCHEKDKTSESFREEDSAS